jgi:hypothetical protein
VLTRIVIGLFLLATPAAALANGGVPIPEGSQATLFALGLLGVIVGRRASMRPPGSSDREDPKQD